MGKTDFTAGPGKTLELENFHNALDIALLHLQRISRDYDLPAPRIVFPKEWQSPVLARDLIGTYTNSDRKFLYGIEFEFSRRFG